MKHERQGVGTLASPFVQRTSASRCRKPGRAGVAGGGKGGVMPGTGRLEYWRRAYERQRAGLDPWGT